MGEKGERNRMFLTQQKLRNRIQELEPYRYRDLWPFSFFSYQEDESKARVIINQFHDIIPGSSIGEVYEDSRTEYTRAYKIAEEIKQDALASFIEEKQNAYTIMNNANWNRTEWVAIDWKEEGIWHDGRGRRFYSSSP